MTYNPVNMPYNKVIDTSIGQLYIEHDGKWTAREYDPGAKKVWQMKPVFQTDDIINMACYLNSLEV